MKWKIEVFETGASLTGGGQTYGYRLYRISQHEDYELHVLMGTNTRFSDKGAAMRAAEETMKRIKRKESTC